MSGRRGGSGESTLLVEFLGAVVAATLMGASCVHASGIRGTVAGSNSAI